MSTQVAFVALALKDFYEEWSHTNPAVEDAYSFVARRLVEQGLVPVVETQESKT